MDKIENYGDRGVWVPEGLSAREIMIGAEVLERDFDVVPYTSRAMIRAVLLAIAAANAAIEEATK